MLSANDFEHVIRSTPLVSIDLLIENKQQEVLLGRRLNKPAQGFWFVPGGRIFKNETLPQALLRIVNNELGLSIDVADAGFRGVYQHFYNDSALGGTTTHYVVLAYDLSLNLDLNHLPQEQHTAYKWLPKAELLRHDWVHSYTKAYFNEGLQ